MAFRKEPELPLGLTIHDLPAWMRKPRREIDWALLVVLVMCAVVVWPLLSRSGLPRNVGIQTELARTIEMAESLQSGILYPRWASNFNYGYGSPIWNHIPPLPHYLTGLHYILAQSNPETSIKLVLASGLVLGGVGMFAFTRRRWGVYGGLLAAALYLFNPQLALVKPYLQSDLPAILAMGLFPVVLWAFDRLLAAGAGRDLALTSFALAALWLTSAPLNMLLVVLVVGWLIWMRVVIRPDRAYWGRTMLAVVCGTAMSAFYWLPSWAEHYAAWWLPVNASQEQTFSLIEILAPPRLLDLSAINPASTVAVGPAVWLLAVVALGMMVRQAWRRTPPYARRSSRGEALQWRIVHFLRYTTPAETETFYFIFLGVILLFGVSRTSRLWDNPLDLSPVNLHDVLPVVIACWSIGAAQIGHRLGQSRHALVAAGTEAICLALVVVAALPVLYPPLWPERYFIPDLPAVLLDETRGYTAGSQVAGILLPKAVEKTPILSRMLMESYESDMVDKVARDLLPPATQVDIIEHRPQSERLVTRSTDETVLTLLTFNYPGWRAKIDGDPVTVTTGDESGFITLRIPAGRHEVEVYLGTTGARIVGWILAFGALLTVAITSLRQEYLLRESRSGHSPAEPAASAPRVYYAVFLAAALIVGAGGAVPHLAPDWFTADSPRGEVQSAAQFQLALQGGIDLLGYEIGGDGVFSPEDTVKLTLYWRAVRPDLPDYQVNLSIVAEDDPDRKVGSVQHRHPGLIPSSQWSAWPLLDSYVRDVYYIPLEENAVPGRYELIAQVGPCSQATILPCETIDPLFVRDGRGASLGQRIVLPAWIELTPEN